MFSTSSPSATSGGGQSNSPVCICSFFHPRSPSAYFPVSLSVFDFCLTVTRYPSLLPLSRIGAHFGYRSARPLPVQGSATENFTLSYRHNHETTITSQSPNTTIMATMAANDRETTQPTCQNCTTSTTPLWRRDEIGSVLCNACGLFLKLHGRPRPISLKTDVIKSRNRVKSSGSAQGAKKKVSNTLHPTVLKGR